MTGIVLTARKTFAFMVARKPSKTPGKQEPAIPKFRYDSVDEAVEEAQRRVREKPADAFLVLQEVMRVEAKPGRRRLTAGEIRCDDAPAFLSSSARPPRADEPGDHAPRVARLKGRQE